MGCYLELMSFVVEDMRSDHDGVPVLVRFSAPVEEGKFREGREVMFMPVAMDLRLCSLKCVLLICSAWSLIREISCLFRSRVASCEDFTAPRSPPSPRSAASTLLSAVWLHSVAAPESP